ncbi:G-type lectin S-receptor-like serine/threonine-protein kinase SD2-5 [Selaginella moellendorffii]|nr:G-type lectin S-receptor-like serine/threonine-protein kinase SD2-5 [Selaginella moellendorffii]|eukprot:XP_024537826.1 G-type lectin S-receptor-like serine/threonine-protein kinase SD2-5 [Selaginella moellendorffii]
MKQQVVALFLLRLALLIVRCKGKLYPIPDGWRAFINESAPELPGDGRSGSYRLLSAVAEGRTPRTRELLLSDNENFGLAFLNFNGTNKYYLALMFGTRNSSTAAPVWIANRDIPVTENCMLNRVDGRLQLLDRNGSIAWSSEQSTAFIGIENSGNLQLYNESRITVWEFFDHPSNALLPNQKLVTGQVLVSNKDASDPSEGPFILQVEPSGMVAYMRNPPKAKQPYLLWSLTGTSLSSATGNCAGFRTAVSLSPAGEISLAYEPVSSGGNQQPCGSSRNGKIFPGNTTMRYFQFGNDGIIVSFRREFANGSWQLETLDQYFQQPVPCGSYGLFERGKQCQCFTNETNNSTTSVPEKCSRPEWSSLHNCSTRYETDFVTMAGTSYITDSYNPPNRTGAPLEECLEECKSTCSCAAFFYDRALQNCFYVEDVLGSLTLDPSKANQLVGFLKYQNYSRLVSVDHPRSETAKHIVIGVTSGSAAIAITILAVMFAALHRRNVLLREVSSFLTRVEASPFQFSYRGLYSATKGFTTVLGQGGYSTVYEGVLHNKMKLAVKKLSAQHAQKQFIAEVQALGGISHINIVKLHGFCAEASHRLLVYEFMPNGSLDRWIFSDSKNKLDWKLRHSIALDTARGLAYLHEESRDSIIHLDIKPQNILLGDKFEAKVADFGMAKLLMDKDENGVLTGVRGTPGYLAPEWLMHSTATKKCDVYSYGMVLLELIGGRRNLDCSKVDTYFPAWAMREVQRGNAMEVVDPSIRASADAAKAKNLIHAAFWCVQEDPATRPTMDAVVRMLESEEEIEPPPLNFHFDVQAPGILSIAVDGDGTTFSYRQEP